MSDKALHSKLSNAYINKLLGEYLRPAVYLWDKEDILGYDAVKLGMIRLAESIPIGAFADQENLVLGIEHLDYDRETALYILSFIGKNIDRARYSQPKHSQ